MKAIKEIEKRIEELCLNTGKEVENIKEKLRNIELEKKDVLQAMKEAEKVADVDAFLKAKNRIEDINDIVDMLRGRIEALDHRTLISVDEYDAGVNKLMDTMNAITDAAIIRIIECMEQVRAIAKEWSVNIEHGNELLSKWQHDIAKDDATQILPNGTKIHMDSLEKRYTDYRIANFSRYVFENNQYEELRKGIENHDVTAKQ